VCRFPWRVLAVVLESHCFLLASFWYIRPVILMLLVEEECMSSYMSWFCAAVLGWLSCLDQCQKSLSPKAAKSRAHFESSPIFTDTGGDCSSYMTIVIGLVRSQLLLLYGYLWLSVCINVTGQITTSIYRLSPSSGLKFATDLIIVNH
jgi:hypothetical protein